MVPSFESSNEILFLECWRGFKAVGNQISIDLSRFRSFACELFDPTLRVSSPHCAGVVCLKGSNSNRLDQCAFNVCSSGAFKAILGRGSKLQRVIRWLIQLKGDQSGRLYATAGPCVYGILGLNVYLIGSELRLSFALAAEVGPTPGRTTGGIEQNGQPLFAHQTLRLDKAGVREEGQSPTIPATIPSPVSILAAPDQGKDVDSQGCLMHEVSFPVLGIRSLRLES
jgi:hypothetical protein